MSAAIAYYTVTAPHFSKIIVVRQVSIFESLQIVVFDYGAAAATMLTYGAFPPEQTR